VSEFEEIFVIKVFNIIYPSVTCMYQLANNYISLISTSIAAFLSYTTIDIVLHVSRIMFTATIYKSWFLTNNVHCYNI